jgi:hypothetical protein
LKRIVSERVIQLIWFIASVYATGALWFYLSKEDYVSAIASIFGAVVLCAMAVYLHGLNDRSIQLRVQREQLGHFLKEAEALSAQANDIPPPIEAHSAWMERVETYLTEALDSSYTERFGNFHGMTFYGTSNPNSGLKQSLEGRSRRLHEFIAELGQK